MIDTDDSRYHSQASYPPRIPIITSITFSPDGVFLLIGTAGNVHYVVDSHRGYIIHRLRNNEGLEKGSMTEGQELSMVPEAGISGQECGWTPDGRFVYSGASVFAITLTSLSLLYLSLSGGSDNKVRFWLIPDYIPDESVPPNESSNLFPSSELTGHPASPTRVVRFNPRQASK